MTGNALNVESGLEELLEHLLFPLLLGHGLCDQPHLLPREYQHEQITDTQLRQAVETVDNSSALGPIVRDIPGGAAAEADRPGDTTPS
ncbi:hypothetical protein AB0L97_37450 [Nocardia sp. NPDC051911]|uniref:hypothetical protein n=1 Tax=Nocardia sp. NPDC051911 TaxID=3154648 RepID=UPI003427C578